MVPQPMSVEMGIGKDGPWMMRSACEGMVRAKWAGPWEGLDWGGAEAFRGVWVGWDRTVGSDVEGWPTIWEGDPSSVVQFRLVWGDVMMVTFDRWGGRRGGRKLIGDEESREARTVRYDQGCLGGLGVAVARGGFGGLAGFPRHLHPRAKRCSLGTSEVEEWVGSTGERSGGGEDETSGVGIAAGREGQREESWPTRSQWKHICGNPL
ncbi:hypothetical protein K2173_022487 [Erythroxylum novogranatense]|uniref:Uncharacterized protein n=1 Tax=Erythroxylum novogranatense TaxID=1862640 RepID=A0AAV8TKF2_9ROSI|nr:hypothetical protein K2173_022487 [Erythroxylum novogranatense]